MPTNTTAYDIGDLVRLGVTITTTSGKKVDTGMTLVVRFPAGAGLTSGFTKIGPITVPGTSLLTHDTTGVWHHYHKVSRAGRHTYQWLSTGTVTLSTGGAFTVRNKYAST